MWTPRIEFFIEDLMDIKSNLKDTEPKYSGKSGTIFCLWCSVIQLSHLKRANLKLSRQDFVQRMSLYCRHLLSNGTIDYFTSVPSGLFSTFVQGFSVGYLSLLVKTQKLILYIECWSPSHCLEQLMKYDHICLINFNNVTKKSKWDSFLSTAIKGMKGP